MGLLKLFQGPVVRQASVYAHVVQESIMPLKHLVQGIDKSDDCLVFIPCWFSPFASMAVEYTQGF
jgi:hypothetical protein